MKKQEVEEECNHSKRKKSYFFFLHFHFPLSFHLGCTCFLLLVCNRTTVCGAPGDAAAYNIAAKNIR